MKKLLLLPLLFLFANANAQHYVRTRHNFGVTASYSFFDATQLKPGTRNAGTGTSMSLGITRQWHRVLYPELFVVQHAGKMPYANEIVVASPYQTFGIGAGITGKFDLFSIDNKKKNGYCFGRVINLLLGVEDVQTIGKNLPGNFNPKNEFTGKIGLGMYSVWGGSSRKHQAWTIHWETYYRYGFSPFMTAVNPATAETEKWHHGSFVVNLRVLHHKTYKFSEM